MSNPQGVAAAVMHTTKPTPNLMRLMRRALADAWKETREALATADASEREALEALIGEIETALANAEMDLLAMEGPTFSERVAQRRERATPMPATLHRGPRHG